MSENVTLKYVHKDHLGGTSVVTSDNGTLIESLKYYSFGETRALTGGEATDKLFTGQRLDGTGLYYYNARYYDPTIGRFISPDTIIPNPANPQSFNRYSYCLNNPLKYTDPSGHDVIINGTNMGEYYTEEYDFNAWKTPEVKALESDPVFIAYNDWRNSCENAIGMAMTIEKSDKHTLFITSKNSNSTDLIDTVKDGNGNWTMTFNSRRSLMFFSEQFNAQRKFGIMQEISDYILVTSPDTKFQESIIKPLLGAAGVQGKTIVLGFELADDADKYLQNSRSGWQAGVTSILGISNYIPNPWIKFLVVAPANAGWNRYQECEYFHYIHNRIGYRFKE